MSQSHSQIASFIWSICNLLRGPYKRNEYRKVILPLTVIRRFDCILEPSKDKVLAELPHLYGKSDNIIHESLTRITGVPFYNKSRLDFRKLLDDPNQITVNLQSYINDFSPNVQRIIEKFKFSEQISSLAEHNLLFLVLQRFVSDELDLSPAAVDNMQMGLIFEELIRIGAEQSNEEAGEHFTPREVIKLMVNLLLSPESDLSKSHVVKTIYDPACGTGGMLTAAETYIKELNRDAKPVLYGQDWNNESYAICCSDMLIKGEDSENIKNGCSFEQDGFPTAKFDYMLANPPFGVEWKKQEKTIKDEFEALGFNGRFGAGLPRINDGSLLFLQHMISKMRPLEQGGSRIAIVFNGSPLFTGDAGSGESNIRRWIIASDWLEAIIALPDQLFYNTGISTYIWIITNKKEAPRRGKIQLIDARQFYHKMRKSLGNKRNVIGDGDDMRHDHISEITRIYGDFIHNQIRSIQTNGEPQTAIVSKIFDNNDFGYSKIVVERPLRLNFQASSERIARLDRVSAFAKLAESKKKDPAERLREIEAGKALQEKIRTALNDMDDTLYRNREQFQKALKQALAKHKLSLPAALNKAILEALSERDESADICHDAKGRPEADSELRDTENVPLKEDIEAYFQREVLPHVPDAWIDHSKTKIGYEIPLNRHFYVYTPPRPLEVIEAEMKALEREIAELLEGI